MNMNMQIAINALKAGYAKAEEMLQDSSEIDRLLQRVEKKMANIPKVGDKLSVIPTLVSLLRSYVFGEYKDVPIGTVIIIVSALIYFISPYDLIPDAIPGAGLVDDAFVMAACINLIQSDVEEFQNWRINNNKVI